jgi:hypothetical protein
LLWLYAGWRCASVLRDPTRRHSSSAFKAHLYITAETSAKRASDSLQGAIKTMECSARRRLCDRESLPSCERRLGGAGLHRLRSKAHLRRCRKQPTTLDRCLCGLLLWVVSPAAASSEGTLVRTRGDRVSITGRAGTIRCIAKELFAQTGLT